MDILNKYVCFHDWQINSLSCREGSRLVLGLSFDAKRAELAFVGTSRCVVEHFAILNIVYEIEVLPAEGAEYQSALTLLAKSDQFGKTRGSLIARVYAAAGAEMTVECESLEVTDMTATHQLRN
ncbi:conserved hypothetical protein [Burkholderia sp. 8Y]|uniref:hypothetical protein n=1 Tax=Burkholderia sp. 8Y TaxID=2653133 RepID=UPI0012F0B640|nr:hypothetical protein [Burkholderia sp. 8Y]VXC75805.1 conserved hypothetical protein [Burkholderia sp. 8Y]